MNSKLIMTVEEMADRNKWLEMRAKGLGGSDAAVVLGISKWRSKYDLWLEKTGQTDFIDDGDQESEFLYWGHKLEEIVAEEFSKVTGKKVRRCGLMQSNDYPFMFASVDRLVVGENAGLECKTTSGFNSKNWADDEIPDTYLCQCLHYMAVTGADRWYIACLIGGNHFVWKCIERSDVEEDIKALIEAESDFWQKNIVERTLPEADGSDACTKALAKTFKGGDTQAEELGQSFDLLCEEIEQFEADKKKYEELITERKNKIRLALGNAEFGRSPSYNIWFKTSKPRETFDAKAFAKDYPDLKPKYTKLVPSRMLRIRRKAGIDD